MRSRAQKLFDDIEDLRRHMKIMSAVVQNPMPIRPEDCEMFEKEFNNLTEEFYTRMKEVKEYIADVRIDSGTRNGKLGNLAYKLLQRAEENGQDGDIETYDVLTEDAETLLKYVHSEDDSLKSKVDEILGVYSKDVNKETTVCFTGPRPANMFGYNIDTIEYKKVLDDIQKTVRTLYHSENARTFIVGGAQGFDTLAAIALYSMKSELKDIKIVLAAPFKNQDIKWPADARKLYTNIKGIVDEVVYVDALQDYAFSPVSLGEYHPNKMHLRNHYMVDRSDIVIAYNNGKGTGTKNCINYATGKRRRIINLYKEN